MTGQGDVIPDNMQDAPQIITRRMEEWDRFSIYTKLSDGGVRRGNDVKGYLTLQAYSHIFQLPLLFSCLLSIYQHLAPRRRKHQVPCRLLERFRSPYAVIPSVMSMGYHSIHHSVSFFSQAKSQSLLSFTKWNNYRIKCARETSAWSAHSERQPSPSYKDADLEPPNILWLVPAPMPAILWLAAISSWQSSYGGTHHLNNVGTPAWTYHIMVAPTISTRLGPKHGHTTLLPMCLGKSSFHSYFATAKISLWDKLPMWIPLTGFPLIIKRKWCSLAGLY